MGTAGWEGAEEAISGRALAEEPSQPVSGAGEREERILMQRCCSGLGRAHTYAPSPAAAAPGQPVAKAGGAKQPRGWRQGLLTGWQQHCPSQHPSRTPGRCLSFFVCSRPGASPVLFQEGLRAQPL